MVGVCRGVNRKITVEVDAIVTDNGTKDKKSPNVSVIFLFVSASMCPLFVSEKSVCNIFASLSRSGLRSSAAPPKMDKLRQNGGA